MNCFDLSKKAKITLYVEQPKPNSRDTWTGSKLNPNVGHTFVSITQGGITRNIGFYPNGRIYPTLKPSANSVLRNDSEHIYHVSVSTNITSSQLSSVVNNISNFNSTYNLDSYNCTDFGIEIANSVGMNIPDTRGTWDGGGGSNPGDLGQDIRNLTSNSNRTVNTTAGRAPKNNGKCN